MEITKVVKPYIRRGGPDTFDNIVCVCACVRACTDWLDKLFYVSEYSNPFQDLTVFLLRCIVLIFTLYSACHAVKPQFVLCIHQNVMYICTYFSDDVG